MQHMHAQNGNASAFARQAGEQPPVQTAAHSGRWAGTCPAPAAGRHTAAARRTTRAAPAGQALAAGGGQAVSGGAAGTGVGRGGAAAQRICGSIAGRPSSRGRRGKECPVQAHSPTHRREAPVGRRPRLPRDQTAAASDGSPRDGRRGPGELGVGQHCSVRAPRGCSSY